MTAAFASDARAGRLPLPQLKDEGTTKSLPPDATGATLTDLLDSGLGAVVRFEDLPQGVFEEMDTLTREFKAATGLHTTAHVYLGRKGGSRALQPHTDPCA